MTEEVTDLTRGVYRRVYGGFIYGQRINKLSLSAEAWFWRVLVTVDDFGNGRADPDLCRDVTAGGRRVTAKQVSGWLREMQQAGLIQFYEAKGEPLLHIAGFEQSQPAGKNGKRIKRYFTPDESGGIRVNPDLSSASDNDNYNDTDNDMSRAAQSRRVFGFWQTHFKHPKAVFDSKRRGAVEARLRDGYTEEQLTMAVKGCRLTPYNMGKNDRQQVYDDIELICRDATHVDRFIARVVPEPVKPKSEETEGDRIVREGCERCHATGTEIIPGRGARPCDHARVNSASSPIIGSAFEDCEARVS